MHARALLILMLIFAFPLGLYIMWSEARWENWKKWTITGAWVLVIILCIVLVARSDLTRDEGSVSVNMKGENLSMLAPLPPQDVPVTNQWFSNSGQESTLISVPTPTPVPTYVYCNDNGKYYHLKGCRYVMEKTPRVTITQAQKAGKRACATCNPPKEETYGY